MKKTGSTPVSQHSTMVRRSRDIPTRGVKGTYFSTLLTVRQASSFQLTLATENFENLKTCYFLVAVVVLLL